MQQDTYAARNHMTDVSCLYCHSWYLIHVILNLLLFVFVLVTSS